MDTSEQYIRMSDYPEIQNQRPMPSEETDWDRDCVSLFYLPVEKRVEVLKWDNDTGWFVIGGYNDDSSGAIWLPTQAQLQEMVDNVPTYMEKLGGIYRAVRDFRLTEKHWTKKQFPFSSMEQLWLAFVMKEKFNKTWNTNKWED